MAPNHVKQPLAGNRRTASMLSYKVTRIRTASLTANLRQVLRIIKRRSIKVICESRHDGDTHRVQTLRHYYAYTKSDYLFVIAIITRQESLANAKVSA